MTASHMIKPDQLYFGGVPIGIKLKKKLCVR